MNQEDLRAFGKVVSRTRRDQRLSKEAAARAAGISSITWKRVEDGLSVHDVNLRAVARSLGLPDPFDVSDEPGSEVKAGREKLGLSRRDMAELLGAGTKTVAEWEAGAPMPPPYLDRLRAILAGTPDDLLLDEVRRRFQTG